MRKDKNLAFELRKKGKSYNDIERQLHIPKSTLSGWFSNVCWSEDIKKNLVEVSKKFHTERIKNLSRDRGEKLKIIYKRAKEEAENEFKILKNNPFFIASIMLYWGEGDKLNKGRCCLSNSDPDMIRLFALFLGKVCGVEKARIKAWILAYPDINQEEALEYWSNKSLIDKKNFTKTMIIKSRSEGRKLSFGVCNVLVSSSYLKVKILTWIKLLSEELTKQNASIV